MLGKRQFNTFLQNNSFFCLFIGIITGFLVGRLNNLLIFPVNPYIDNRSSANYEVSNLTERLNTNKFVKNKNKDIATTNANLVLIGVMTAKSYINTRVLAAYKTWVKDAPGRVIFFSSEGSSNISNENITVIGLKGVDDTYPPQKKSFMMLKYMHDHYAMDYKYFMRADDDVYIKGKELASFLHSISASNRALYIGQAGLGTKAEFGLLHLKNEENFCMGGTSIILTRETLIKVVPHIGTCLKNLYTNHEDVEIGRCISKYSNVSCTWSYEMQNILYNNYREPKGSFSHSLKDPNIHRAIVLHPIKNSSYLYRLHQYFLTRNSLKLRNEILQAHKEINKINSILQDRDEFNNPNRLGLMPSLLKFSPTNKDEIYTWDFISKYGYSVNHINPRRSLEIDLQYGITDIVIQLMESINENMRLKGRVIDFKEILYGYNRFNPLYGADYILDMLLVYRKFKGRQRMTVPVRRHVYVQQPFLEPEILIENLVPEGMKISNKDENENKFTDRLNQRINFILPLSGRYKTLLQFMLNFEEICLKTSENVSILVMLFQSVREEDRFSETIDFLTRLVDKYPDTKISVQRMEGEFSRGMALQHGTRLFKDGELLFYIDVDIYMKRDALTRIRLNTIQGKQVYYPIVFSQYNPKQSCLKSSFSIKDRFENEENIWNENIENKNSVFNAENIGLFNNNYKSEYINIQNQLFIKDRVNLNYNQENILKIQNTNKYTTFESYPLEKDLDLNYMNKSISNNNYEYDVNNNYSSSIQSSFESDKPLKLDVDSKYNCSQSHTNAFHFDSQYGYWREFGYGIVSVYKQDFDHIGGFDIDIKGWGKEDVDLVERFISHNISVFRSIDPSMVHIYHSIICNPELDTAQYQMCLGSKAASYASVEKLADLVFNSPDILKRNEKNSKVDRNFNSY